MKKCPYCGAPIENRNDTMCAYCGSPFSGDQDPDAQYSTEEHYDPRIPAEQQYRQYQEELKARMEKRYGSGQYNELQAKAKLAKVLAFVAILFNSVFIFAIVAIVLASSVKKDKNADAKALSDAKTAMMVAIMALVIGVIFQMATIGTAIS